MEDEHRRRVLRHLLLVGVKLDGSFASGFSPRRFFFEPAVRHAVFHRDDRVGENREVGTATHFVDVVAVFFARVEVRGRGAGEVPAGGEAPDADSFWINPS